MAGTIPSARSTPVAGYTVAVVHRHNKDSDAARRSELFLVAFVIDPVVTVGMIVGAEGFACTYCGWISCFTDGEKILLWMFMRRVRRTR